jgi:cell wall-associated NlpC family hydrolase
MSGLASVAERIQEIQSQFALAAAATSTSRTSSTGATFASALASAQAGTEADPGTTPANPGGPSGADVVADAKKYLGIPYVFGGTNPKTGLDCSGLVQRVFKDLGVSLPRLVRNQMHEGTPVASLAEAKPGDLLIFEGHEHIGIYLGNNKVLHAPEPGDHVKISTVWEKPTSIRRILPSEAATPPAATSPLLRPAALGGTGALGGVPYASLFSAAAAKHGVSAELLAAVAKTESGYNANAVSPAGARGLMQIMPATARGLSVNPMNPAEAIDGAARILKRNLAEFGSLPLALAAYNAGGGAVKHYGGIPPFAETQAYVKKVQAALGAIVAKEKS